ncbi:MAG: 3-hydroxyacyl-CoA dehydrogenase family protein [Bacteroidia bacterium]|nr:3-hydroxyacyl-CoA dehydrogenase family protein [Bacteroidia bacterium]
MAEIKEPIEKYGLSKKDKPKSMFSKVGIVGCGAVGQSIARMISSHGIDVIFIELSEGRIEQAYADISRELDNMIDHWGMTPSDKRSIVSRIHGTMRYRDLLGCDLVIESILSKEPDSLEARKEVFKDIEKYVDPEAIIATNSSTIVITELSSELQYKNRCVSLHFSTTAPDTDLVEVARGLYTADEVYKNVLKFVQMIGKTAVPVLEAPGLISVRIYATLINEALEVLMEGVGSMEDIDITMKRGFGLPLGPFEMADKIGLDKVLQYLDNLYDEFGDKKYKPSPILKRLVRANRLGRKTQQGFYCYDAKGKTICK